MKTTGAETKIQKPKTKKGKRALQAREPKLVSLSRCSHTLDHHAVGTTPNIGIHLAVLRLPQLHTFLSFLKAMLYTCQVEDSKRALILFGGKTSQITKDVLSDLHKLKSSVRTDHCYLFPPL